MTLRQKILQLIYPLLMKLNFSKKISMKNVNSQAGRSFFDLSIQLNSGKYLNLVSLKGKKVLVVNTASNCGYTAQYAELQQLYTQHADKLVIIGFPSNDFKEQEKGNDEEIAQFCQVNFGVTFPLAKKSVVVKSVNQNPLFKWLSTPEDNGWNNEEPSWNFTKYLVNEDGVLTHVFPPAVSPLSKEVVNNI